MKISGIYKITNTVTGDCYIGSSNNIKQRWANHKCHSTWKNYLNNPMYLDMQKYGIDKFEFEILAEIEEDSLKEAEQQFIELLKPTYNNRNANGVDIERCKEYHKEYQKTDKYKEVHRKAKNKYDNQLCYYNGETITLNALSMRFRRMGISNPTQEAKKYIIGGKDD